MENERAELPSDDALTQVAHERRARGREGTRTDTWWFNPALALLAAIMVWAPALGSVWRFTMVMALGTVAITTLESLRERTRGVTRSRPAGRRGWTILIAVGVVLIALIATSFAFVVAGRAELSLLCAAVTFVAMFGLAWLYDASFRSEVPEAR